MNMNITPNYIYSERNLSFNANKTTKRYQVAKVLPKAPWVTQAHLDELFSKEDFAENVLENDEDWLEAWKKSDIPTTGFCYAAMEFWYYFVDPDSEPKRIDEKEKITNPVTGKTRPETHHFLLKEDDGKPADPNKARYKWRDKIILDPSRSQYDSEEPAYEKGKGAGFNGINYPSRKACEIAVALGVISRDLADKMPRIFRGKEYSNLTFEQKLSALKREVAKDKVACSSR